MLLLLGANLICVPLWDMHWGCLRGEERPRSAGDCMSQVPARKTGSIGGISHRRFNAGNWLQRRQKEALGEQKGESR